VTYAPASLLELRAFLTPLTGLSAGNLGIVGDAAHAGRGVSYHLGRDQLTEDAYSRQTARDRAGLTNAASAMDIGNHADLRRLSIALVATARANAPGTADIREIIYTPDGQNVLRWDRERGAASAPRAGEADDSHLWHTHISWYRDGERRGKIGVFAPLYGDTTGDDDMPLIPFELDATEVGGLITVKADGASVVTVDGGSRPLLKAGMIRPAIGTARLAIRGDAAHYQIWVGNELGFVLASDVDFTPYSFVLPDDAHTVAVLVDGQAVWTGEV
jgi:hypothetical protein